MPNSLWLHGLQPISCHFLLQGIFPTQGSNPCLLRCRQILYRLSYKGSPRQSILLNKRQFGGMPYLINLSSYWLWDGWTSVCVCVCVHVPLSVHDLSTHSSVFQEVVTLRVVQMLCWYLGVIAILDIGPRCVLLHRSPGCYGFSESRRWGLTRGSQVLEQGLSSCDTQA